MFVRTALIAALFVAGASAFDVIGKVEKVRIPNVILDPLEIDDIIRKANQKQLHIKNHTYMMDVLEYRERLFESGKDVHFRYIVGITDCPLKSSSCKPTKSDIHAARVVKVDYYYGPTNELEVHAFPHTHLRAEDRHVSHDDSDEQVEQKPKTKRHHRFAVKGVSLITPKAPTKPTDAPAASSSAAPLHPHHHHSKAPKHHSKAPKHHSKAPKRSSTTPRSDDYDQLASTKSHRGQTATVRPHISSHHLRGRPMHFQDHRPVHFQDHRPVHRIRTTTTTTEPSVYSDEQYDEEYDYEENKPDKKSKKHDKKLEGKKHDFKYDAKKHDFKHDAAKKHDNKKLDQFSLYPEYSLY